MNSRQRLEMALNHKEPDQVPVDLGSIVTNITSGANADLKAYLGLQSEDPVVDRIQQLAQPSPDLLDRLHVDTRYIYLSASRDWRDIELPDNCYQDEFGVCRKAAFAPDGWLLYYDFEGNSRWRKPKRWPTLPVSSGRIPTIPRAMLVSRKPRSECMKPQITRSW